ncbi:ZIP family metal transporter, partial [Candidatus Bathyarchaeota archaeon]|nr:ZIP family metal transporter [Candidatus Bathyarchaeota archaeon]
IIAAAFLFLGEKIQKILIRLLVSYATATLLAVALLGLLSEALENASRLSVLTSVLVGFVIFFLLEKMVIWRHCHNKECEIHGTAGIMILIGDLFHNAIDGLVIAASFLSSLEIGIIAGITIIIHEIPQEIGDFAVLLNSGYPKRRAVFYNILSSLSNLIVAIVAYFTLEIIQSTIPYVMAFSAAGFLYIALSDLYPQLHKKREFGSSVQQVIMILAGIGTMFLLLQGHH